METSIRNERIDLRVTPEEKQMFIKAHKLSGDKTFSAFITHIVKVRSSEIIQEKELLLASERDRKMFFKAVFANQKPNKALKNAAKKYKSLAS